MNKGLHCCDQEKLSTSFSSRFLSVSTQYVFICVVHNLHIIIINVMIRSRYNKRKVEGDRTDHCYTLCYFWVHILELSQGREQYHFLVRASLGCVHHNKANQKNNGIVVNNSLVIIRVLIYCHSDHFFLVYVL